MPRLMSNYKRQSFFIDLHAISNSYENGDPNTR